MNNNNKEDTELTPEEQQQLDEFKTSFHAGFKKIIEKIISPLEWCWPVTFLLLIVRYVLAKIGYYELTLTAATIFIWGPFILLVGLVGLFISAIYMISLFGAWDRFMQTSAFYFKLGFQKVKNSNTEKQNKKDQL